ncbi:hypothetical protein IFM89_011807 [Coptis chinensis]|uniref:Myb/SANT-like domain-containing protein n=1 Tax=Coptis chinensis TaxID=261450 RepID=A0A835LGX2_9MAGN|nr:hypothetical protein IFM89_011807 [Coptis chinensis]
MARKQKKVVKTRSPQIRWYPNMEAILVEVLLEELATGGKRADNGWRKESLKRTADEINTRLGMNCVSDNVRSRLKTMRLAWQVAKHAVDASGFGLSFNKETKRIDADENAWESYVKAGNHFLTMTNVVSFLGMIMQLEKGAIVGSMMTWWMEANPRRWGDNPDASESSAFLVLPRDLGGDTSQTESGPRSTTPTSKKTRKSRFFEDIPNPFV